MTAMTRLRRGSKRSQTRLLRRIVQAAFGLFIIISSILHYCGDQPAHGVDRCLLPLWRL